MLVELLLHFFRTFGVLKTQSSYPDQHPHLLLIREMSKLINWFACKSTAGWGVWWRNWDYDPLLLTPEGEDWSEVRGEEGETREKRRERERERDTLPPTSPITSGTKPVLEWGNHSDPRQCDAQRTSHGNGSSLFFHNNWKTGTGLFCIFRIVLLVGSCMRLIIEWWLSLEVSRLNVKLASSAN